MEGFNIIGDVHGRTIWKKLVDTDRVNVFVGDYFDPYDNISYEDLRTNFLNIIEFAKENPGTILLMGNHDLHYLFGGESTRFDREHAKCIRELFEKNSKYIYGVAYAVNDNVLVSHAGFTKEWLDSTDYYGCHSVEDRDKATTMERWANNLFWDGFTVTSNSRYWPDDLNHYGMSHFMFINKAKMDDFYGTSPKQSPVWVRPSTLLAYNALPDGLQIVGHTQFPEISPVQNKVIFIDCLGQDAPASLYLNIDDELKYEIHNVE